MAYNGWMISDEDRERLMATFPPTFEHRRCSHITNEFGDDVVDIPVDADIAVVGYVTGAEGEALLVEVNGMSERPDGKTYHLTMSFPEGSSAAASNDVIERVKPLRVDRVLLRARGFICKGENMPYVTTPLSS